MRSLMNRLPYVQEYRDRHGKIRRYFRRPGSWRIPLPGRPGSKEFMTPYNAAQAGYVVRETKTVGNRSAPGSLSAVIAAYYTDRSFTGELAAETQQQRRTILERFRKDHGNKPIALIERVHIAKILGEKTPSAALNWLTAIRGLTQFAVKVGLLQDDPTVGIERAKLPNTEGFHSWSEEEIAQYEVKHPVGSRARMAMALVLYTALRRGDIVTLGPQHVRDGTITVRPRKTTRTTGTTLHIPVHPALAEILAKTPTKHLTFLTTEAGTPFRPPSLSWRFRTWCDEAGLPHCTAHGLRKAQCRRLAEAGCSVHEIAAISGHKTLSEVRRYTEAVDQARLAKAAIARLRPELRSNESV
jgi:integrase